MEYQVVFSESARKDLFDLYYFVAMNDSFEKADKLRVFLEEKCSTLYHLPYRGLKIKEIYEERPDILQLIARPYTIIYKVVGSDVIILAIIDGRMEMQKVLEARLLR
jgi:toxin ParE1/3/4